MQIPKPGKTKKQLLQSLEELKSSFAKEISGNDVAIGNIPDGYQIKAEKKIMFMKFWVNARIIAMEQAYELAWETNAPEGKVNDAINKVKSVLEAF